MVVPDNMCTTKIASIKQRFADVFTDEEAYLVAELTPKFKLDWIDTESEKLLLIKVLESCVTHVY